MITFKNLDWWPGMTGNFAKNWKMWQKYLKKFGKDELQLNFEKMIHQWSTWSTKLPANVADTLTKDRKFDKNWN
jgi:hypothetical protein